MLEINSSLEVLGLYGNQFQFVNEIGLGLKTNRCLKKLHLSGNKVVDVNSLGEALAYNSTLEDLGLGGNQIVVCWMIVSGSNLRMFLSWDEGCERILG